MGRENPDNIRGFQARLIEMVELELYD